MKKKDHRKGLRRAVSTRMLALYGIGNIVGAGVYVLIGKIAEPAGYLAPLAFVIAALVAFCAALSYAELASRYPVSAGVAVYLHKAFGSRRLSTAAGLMLVAAGTISTAILLKGFAGYFYQLVPVAPWLSMTLLVLLLSFIMLYGIKESVAAAGLFTVIEVGGLLFLIGSIAAFHPEMFSNYGSGLALDASAWSLSSLSGIFAAAFLAFYAFVGFEDMVNIAEEVKNPQKAFPRAILVSMAVVTLLYLAVSVVSLGVLSPDSLSKSTAPLADAYHYATGQGVVVITIISLIATLNGMLVNIIMGSRFLYGMSSRGWITGWFSSVSRRQIPARGVIVVSLSALAAALWLPIESLAQLTSFLLLLVFVAVNISLAIVRKKDTDSTIRKLRLSPVFVPWVGAITSVGLIFSQIAALF